MTSHYPLNSESISQFPYTDQISIKEKEDKVDFVYQYVMKCDVFPNHENTKNCLLGKPINFPNYGYFPETFIMKTYGEVSISPWNSQDHQDEQKPVPWNIRSTWHINNYYVYLEFHEPVYPIRVSIYEVYNPGHISEIWAESDGQWRLLWKGLRQMVSLTSRLFSPPLKNCNFKTNKLKLKFKHTLWNNFTMIDAVMLIGSSELILPKNSKENLTSLLQKMSCSCFNQNDNLTADYKHAHLDIDFLLTNFSEYCTISRRNFSKQIFCGNNLNHEEVFQNRATSAILSHVQSFTEKFSNQLLRCSAMHMTFCKNESQKLSHYENMSLSAFPDEVILKILKNLDLATLCRISEVNKHFYNLTRDPQLYKCLNMHHIYSPNTISNIFCYFTSRCKYLQKLDLSFSEFSVSDFIQFLDNCGRPLTHLRLTGCEVVFNSFALLNISKMCTNLKELDLTLYTDTKNDGFSHLENLESLEHLNLTNTSIDTVSLCKVLKKNQRLRVLNLKHTFIENASILTELRNSCQDLEIINLNHSFVRDIDILADCKNLRKVYLHTPDSITDRLCKLFSSCHRLEEIHLSGFQSHLTDRELEILACENLVKLCLDAKLKSFDKYSILLEQCPKLQELHVPCDISDRLAKQWKKEYPNVSVFPSLCSSKYC